MVWGAAAVAGVLHVVVFAWEALLLSRPGVHAGVFGMRAEDVPPVRLWAFGVGFYNLFLAAGILLGVALWATGSAETVGRTLVVYVAWFMLLSGLVLLVADRMAMGRPRGAGLGGALGQGVPPAVALLAMAF